MSTPVDFCHQAGQSQFLCLIWSPLWGRRPGEGAKQCLSIQRTRLFLGLGSSWCPDLWLFLLGKRMRGSSYSTKPFKPPSSFQSTLQLRRCYLVLSLFRVCYLQMFYFYWLWPLQTTSFHFLLFPKPFQLLCFPLFTFCFHVSLFFFFKTLPSLPLSPSDLSVLWGGT